MAEQVKTDFIVGLDLGQAQDPTALAVLERERRPDQAHKGSEVSYYSCRHLKRWELGTAYPVIVADVCKIVGTPPLGGSLLAVDQTGVGKAIVDMLRLARPAAKLHPILITAGHHVSEGDDGWHVPKKELASVLQVLLQARRLKVAALPLRTVLLDELANFKVKITVAGNETFEAWRERDHDDLVLAVAMAAWLGERLPPRVWQAPTCVDTPRRSLFPGYKGFERPDRGRRPDFA